MQSVRGTVDLRIPWSSDTCCGKILY